MKVVYYKLNQYGDGGKFPLGFPVDLFYIFNDGWNWYPIFRPLQGTIILEKEITGDRIDVKSLDEEVMKILETKKLPNDVALYLEK
jgi:hypothetical protein